MAQRSGAAAAPIASSTEQPQDIAPGVPATSVASSTAIINRQLDEFMNLLKQDYASMQREAAVSDVVDRKPTQCELQMALEQQPGPSQLVVAEQIERKPSQYELLMPIQHELQAGPSEPLDRKPSQYELLMQLNKAVDIIRNSEPSECFLCSKMIPTSRGVMLVNCLHTFCGNCLQISLLEHATVRCPYPYGQFECDGMLEDCEIESLLGQEEYKCFLARQFDAISVDEPPKKAILPEDLELLVTLTDASVVPNLEEFECPVCMVTYDAYEGILLRDCFHAFCRDCLANSIKHADDVVVRCPFQDENLTCDSMIQDREIRALLSDDEYNAHLGRSLRKAESLAVNSYHCKTTDCNGWCLIEDYVEFFRCPICQIKNCLRCKAIHPNMGCEEYQDRLNGNYEEKCTERKIQTLLDSREAMRCPRCGQIVQKIEGCDFITCTLCKTGICWATRGPRWGPAGHGDNSGGCRCNVGGRKCHPSCRNCH